jgi:hypothetical protein
MVNDEYSSFKAVVEVSSDVSQSCKVCNYFVKHDEFAEGINHYITEHGFQLLFVGGRTIRDYDDKPFATTIAILGTSEVIIENVTQPNVEIVYEYINL